uniref:(northern house mosquito) hypothetical protein n=1 Tax=Culex pipiens TaxID=7175 RepID=A0A8D8ALC4_CULPI
MLFRANTKSAKSTLTVSICGSAVRFLSSSFSPASSICSPNTVCRTGFIRLIGTSSTIFSSFSMVCRDGGAAARTSIGTGTASVFRLLSQASNLTGSGEGGQ